MSRLLFRLVLVVTVLAAVTAGGVTPLLAAAPIAHYPLQTDGLDATGINDPMILDNAPFQDGGVYCNGIYPGHPGAFDVETPPISSLSFENLAVSVEFKIDQYPTLEDYRRPILIGGYSYRWLGAEVYTDGTIGFLYNNSHHQASSTPISLGVWHTIVITYDSLSRTGTLYLDNLLVSSAEFDLTQGGDTNFLAINPASGRAFQGVLRELVVYDASYDPTSANGTTWGSVKALYR
jgi:hypothetical protein